jgi:NADH:ubiquinone oxidoreductase subunit E
MGQYERRVFVCTFGKTCAADGGDEVHAELKSRVKAAGLKHRVRVNRAGCMSQCGHGPMVVVYPEGV